MGARGEGLEPASDAEHVVVQTDGDSEPPLLWPIMELAAPLEAKLRHHFASGLPTDRVDRPEWLFGTALRVAREGGVALTPLQPALQDRAAPRLYHIQVLNHLSFAGQAALAASQL